MTTAPPNPRAAVEIADYRQCVCDRHNPNMFRRRISPVRLNRPTILPSTRIRNPMELKILAPPPEPFDRHQGLAGNTGLKWQYCYGCLETMIGRRSVREFTTAPVEEAKLRQLVDAAIQSPSAVNQQPWLHDRQ